MRELALLLAAALALGYYFSDGENAPDPGYEVVAEAPTCRSEACKKIRPAEPGHDPRAVRE